ncbi:MAG: methyl-accepting chemotaxis protein [Oscillospiraceae bacterium]
MKSIAKKISVSTIINVTISMNILCIIVILLNYQNAIKMVQNDMTQLVNSAAGRTQWEIESFRNVAVEAGRNSILTSKAVPNETRKAYLESIAESHGYQRGNFITSDGSGLDGNEYSDREYFQQAMKGNATVSEPLVSKVTGKSTVIVAAPVRNGGTANGQPIGCVYFVPDEEFLNDIVRSIEFSEMGYAYMIDSDGCTIASVDSQKVIDDENIQRLAETDPSYASQAEMHARMEEGETGFARCEIGGVEYYAAYAPIAETAGWSLALVVPRDEIMLDTTLTLVKAVVIMLALITISAFAAYAMGKKIGEPIRKVTDRIDTLSEGDLSGEVAVIEGEDEVARLSHTTAKLTDSLNTMIGDVNRILSAMSAGDLNVDTEQNKNAYVGDFSELIESIRNINHTLSNTMYTINQSAFQVSSGSDQVSMGAQSLAQGAAEQASSIEELAATIHTISEQVKQNSANCENGKQLVEEAGMFFAEANDRMDDLTAAMTQIGESSDEIGKIIKTIEDIAFQTNILALNAAVEAARAGEAGKGFAVVADEVRNLASKSADAAQNTTALIEHSMEAVRRGTGVAKDVVEVVRRVEGNSMQVKDIVDEIADASVAQIGMIDQISVGIDQISSVVQSNTATSEQSAAASEELSGQADSLKSLIGRFKLKK